MASDEIERFRREIVERGGKLAEELQGGKELDDVTLLREVMNTVGKYGQLGGSIRCVVSVSMLTEGWDANTVTHVLGVRAFGTQLLCEQVIGRALRRQSYDLNEDGLFNVEYADVLGIPFDFTAKPVVAPPQPPRETIQVKAMRPERDALEIRFPRVEGYRVELPEDRLSAEFNDDSVLELTPDLVGATETQNSGIIGEQVDLNLVHTGDVRPSQVLYELTSHLVLHRWRDPGEDAKLHLFGQLKRIAKQWLDGYLVCKGGTYPAQLKYKMLADMACSRIIAGINRKFVGERPIKAVLDPYNPTGSTMHVNFNTSKTLRWETDARRCHVNWVILDSDWEAEFCRVAEAHPRVRAYVKNHNLGLEVPYRYGSEMRKYRPDFIVRVDDGHGDDDLLNLIVEIKGYRREDAKEKKSTMDTYWVPGVNHLGTHGRWAFAEFTEVYQIEADFKAKVEGEFNKMIESVTVADGSVGTKRWQKSNPPPRPSRPSSTTRPRGRNIPTAEYQSVLQKTEQSPVRVAYERRNRDLDPQLVWRGKDEQDWSDLVVHAPPLYIQEKVQPKALIDDLLRETREREHEAGQTTADLFADFNGIPKGVDKTEFYQHDQNWSNRMILGDSLQVMASLAEREGLRGKVQCIYFDPPYGIKFNSNFQWSTTSRDVKDGNVDHITREPEQVKAFRDTWRDGIHSYLTYLRDRLTVARDLLTDSGSIFVQIGDENVHRVRAVMDEVFGDENFVSHNHCQKTTGSTASDHLAIVSDYILWYAKRRRAVKYRPVYLQRSREVGEAQCSAAHDRMSDGVVDVEAEQARRWPSSRMSARPFRPITSLAKRRRSASRHVVSGRSQWQDFISPKAQVWKTE